MRPANAPDTAIPIPPPGGPFPHQQLDQIHSIMVQVDYLNANAQANFDHACADWTAANTRNRYMGLPLAPKPAPGFIQTVQTAIDDPPETGIIWLWLSNTLMEPCPDLPPIPGPAGPNHIHVGRRISGPWFVAASDDTYPVDGIPVFTTSDDGVGGTFVRVASPVGNGWWQWVRS